MKAILINPETKTISEVQLEKGIDAIHKLIDCECFTCPLTYPNGDALYCDDEGLLNKDKIVGGFMYPDWVYPIVNKALIIGTNLNTGNSRDAKSSVEEVQNGIRWLNREICVRWAEEVCG